MKIALASVIKASASTAPERNRIRNTSAVLRKLSLNAAKNWHQNSGAKRLDSIRGGGMPTDYCRVPPRQGDSIQKNLAAFRPPKEDRCQCTTITDDENRGPAWLPHGLPEPWRPDR